MADLLCTTDLTPASDNALRHALAMGDRLGARISVLHCMGRGARGADAKAQARAAIEHQLEAAGAASVRILLPEGDFMTEIGEESKRGHQLLIMGTHGPKGLRQTLFGADILTEAASKKLTIGTICGSGAS